MIFKVNHLDKVTKEISAHKNKSRGAKGSPYWNSTLRVWGKEKSATETEWVNSEIGGKQGNYAVMEAQRKHISRKKEKCSLTVSNAIDKWGQRLTIRFSKVISPHLNY